jgi:Xaa-Pro aminopeptidase
MENKEYELRRHAVAGDLPARKLDALLVAMSPNLRYLSGFTGSNGALLVLPGKSILFSDPRYEIQAAEESTCTVRIVKGPLMDGVLAAIQRLRLRRIGYEPARMTCEFRDSLHSRLPARSSLEPVRGWIEDLRMIKSPAELALIRRSVQTNSRAFERTVASLKPGMSESGLAAELEYRMRRLGAEKPSFDTIVAAGARSALPHAQPSGAPLATGGLVVVDMGTFQDGYASDMTRMLFVGAPPPKIKRMYRAVLEAQLAAIDAVRDGVRTAAVDAAARRVLKGYGLDQAFTHSTGHGLGLEIHEPPRLGKRDKLRLKTGMAVTIEPGVYIKGLGGVRIEDTIVVTKSGCEILTPTPKNLWLVE